MNSISPENYFPPSPVVPRVPTGVLAELSGKRLPRLHLHDLKVLHAGALAEFICEEPMPHSHPAENVPLAKATQGAAIRDPMSMAMIRGALQHFRILGLNKSDPLLIDFQHWERQQKSISRPRIFGFSRPSRAAQNFSDDSNSSFSTRKLWTRLHPRQQQLLLSEDARLSPPRASHTLRSLHASMTGELAVPAVGVLTGYGIQRLEDYFSRQQPSGSRRFRLNDIKVEHALSLVEAPRPSPAGQRPTHSVPLFS